MDYGMLHYLPSTIAASCVTTALYIMFHATPGCTTWSATLSHYSGYLPRDLHHCSQVGRPALGMTPGTPLAAHPSSWLPVGDAAPTPATGLSACDGPCSSPSAGGAPAVHCGQELQPACRPRQVCAAQVWLRLPAGLPHHAARLDVPVSVAGRQASQQEAAATPPAHSSSRPEAQPSVRCEARASPAPPPRFPSSRPPPDPLVRRSLPFFIFIETVPWPCARRRSR